MPNADDDLVTPRTPEQWALLCALKIQEEHGDRSHVFIAEMIGRFALEGNFSAIETYKGIARAYDQLMRPPDGLN